MKRKKLLERIKVDRKVVEYLRAGKSLTSITKELKKGKGYVIKIRDQAIEYGFLVCATDGNSSNYTYAATTKELPPFPEALFPLRDGRSEKLIETDKHLENHKSWITERLENSWTPQTVFEELPIAIPRANFYRYLHRHSLMTKNIFKNVLEIIHAPGESLQVDWGKLTDVIDSKTNKKKTIWIFIGTLGHSRYRMVRVVERLDYQTTIDALISMFEEMGGTPKKLTSDNPKVFVIGASPYEPNVNPAFERFASYYGFTIEALPPRTPELKGKVERIVNPIRRLFEPFDFNNYSMEKAQDHINKKLFLQNERKHGTHGMKPLDVFINDEAILLKPLPQLRYELEIIEFSTVRNDGYVRFRGKYYRIDQRLKKEVVTVIANKTKVNIYCKGKLLECYDRITDPFQTKTCKDHYKETWEKTLKDNDFYIKKACAIGEDVAKFINIVLARGEGFIDTRTVWGVLTLDKKYYKEDINDACKSAMELSQVSYSAVRKLLTISGKLKPKNIKSENENHSQTVNGKFTRPMSEYKKLYLVVNNNRNEGGIE